MSKVTKCKLGDRVSEESDATRILQEYLKRDIFSHLDGASIHMYWHEDWAADLDGVCVGAQITKPNELMRTLAGANGESVDLVILLPQDSWNYLPEKEKRRRIFHELLHAKPAIDKKTGEQKVDERGRLQWRLAKHHYNVFREELEEFGTDAVIQSIAVQDDASRYAQRPLEKVFDEVSGEKANGDDPTKWRSLKLSALNLAPKIETALREAGIKTLGKLSDVMNEGGWWYRSIKGIGQGAVVAIADAFEMFWDAHPEYVGPSSLVEA